MTAPRSPWTPLDVTAPMRSLRHAAGLSMAAACAALGAPGTPVPLTTLTSAEVHRDAILYAKLLTRAAAFGLELEIRVRRRP